MPARRDFWNPGADENRNQDAVGSGLSEDERNSGLLNLLSNSITLKQYDKARSLAERITRLDARTASLRHIDYREAADSLHGGRIERFEELVSRIPAGPERCLLAIAMAARRVSTDRASAVDSVLAALRDVSGIEAPIPQLLIAAHLLAPHDTKAALALLRQAVMAINEDYPRKRAEESDPHFWPRRAAGVIYRGDRVTIKLGRSWHNWFFMPHEGGDIGSATTALARFEFGNTERTVLAIVDEAQLTLALSRLAGVAAIMVWP